MLTYHKRRSRAEGRAWGPWCPYVTPRAWSRMVRHHPLTWARARRLDSPIGQACLPGLLARSVPSRGSRGQGVMPGHSKLPSPSASDRGVIWRTLITFADLGPKGARGTLGARLWHLGSPRCFGSGGYLARTLDSFR